MKEYAGLTRSRRRRNRIFWKVEAVFRRPKEGFLKVSLYRRRIGSILIFVAPLPSRHR